MFDKTGKLNKTRC